MSATGDFRLQGNLDPAAQEFVPGNPYLFPTPIPLFTTPSVYFPFSSPTSQFVLPPPSPSYPPNDVQVLAFCPPPPPQYNHSHPGESYAVISRAPRLPFSSAAPTRAVVLISTPVDVSESTVRRDLEVFGDVRGVQMERVEEGIVTVHFYDLRHAQTALREIREQHMQHQLRFRSQLLGLSDLNPASPPVARGLVSARAVWAQFVMPASNAVPDGNNQGTLVIFNLEPTVSSRSLKEIFQAYGPVKELRETPYKKHQRFIEFFDVRDAAKALRERNGKEIEGKPIVIEYSRPGGYSKKLFLRSNYIKTSATNHQPPLPPPQRLSCHPLPIVSSRARSLNCSMGSLSLNSAVERNTGNGSQWKSASRKGREFYNNKLQHKGCGKPAKGKNSRKREARFVISDDATADSRVCRDGRTTLMIKNIPNKYSQKLLLNMLDNHCIYCNEQTVAQGKTDEPLSSYDFVYLPMDFNNKCNVGYGFVNMTSPQAAWRLYKAFHLQRWEVFNSRKICEVTYARVQGLEALKEHFKNSKFPLEAEQYVPVVFSPPRDGRRLSEPLPVVDHRRTVGNTDGYDEQGQIDGADLHEDGLLNSLSCSGMCRQNDGACADDAGKI